MASQQAAALNISQTLVRHRGSFVSGGLEISPPKAMWAQN